MTPQGQFTILAPIAPRSEPALRSLLATMNRNAGMADPGNPVVPFEQFERLHFARFAILDDATSADIEVYGVPRPDLPQYLAFIGDCDGPAQQCLAELSERADPGLRRIFGHCALNRTSSLTPL